MTQPYNAVTNKPYLGGNASLLAGHELWAGLKQWNSKGLSVKKGERGTRITVLFTVTDKNGNLKTVPRNAFVFHAGQVEPTRSPELPGIAAQADEVTA
jgi:antirestriction protein ArdC